MDQPDPEVPLTHLGGNQNRWLAVGTIVVAAILGLGIAKPWDRLAPSPTAIAQSDPPSTRPTSIPSARLALTGTQAWLLDFDGSGLSSAVCLDGGGSTCPPSPRLGSSIRFEDDEIIGATGLGGGCDHFVGSVDLREEAPGSIKITIADYEGRCYLTGVDREIRDRLNRAAEWRVEDERLTFLDSDGAPLLTYDPSR